MRNCVKCGGCMVREYIRDYWVPCLVRRCLNCGAMIDRIIALNRRRRLPVKGWVDRERFMEGEEYR